MKSSLANPIENSYHVLLYVRINDEQMFYRFTAMHGLVRIRAVNIPIQYYSESGGRRNKVFAPGRTITKVRMRLHHFMSKNLQKVKEHKHEALKRCGAIPKDNSCQWDYACSAV